MKALLHHICFWMLVLSCIQTTNAQNASTSSFQSFGTGDWYSISWKKKNTSGQFETTNEKPSLQDEVLIRTEDKVTIEQSTLSTIGGNLTIKGTLTCTISSASVSVTSIVTTESIGAFNLTVEGDLTVNSGAKIINEGSGTSNFKGDFTLEKGGYVKYNNNSAITFRRNVSNKEDEDKTSVDLLGFDLGGLSKVSFLGKNPQSYTGTSGNLFVLPNIIIQNNAGVSLGGQNSNVKVGNSLAILGGTITLNKSNLELSSNIKLTKYDQIPGTYIQTNDIGAVTVTGVVKGKEDEKAILLPVGNSTYNPVKIINASANPADYTVRVEDQVRTAYTNGVAAGSKIDGKVVNRTWWIHSPSTDTNTNIELFWKEDDELDNFDRASSFIAHYENGSWDNGGASGIAKAPVGATSIERPNITTFSPFTVASDPTALPVELLAFHAVLESDATVYLDWATASETNNDYFEIEHSANSRDFKAVGTVYGNGTTTEKSIYDFVHDTPATGRNYYRLKQVDYDGSASYSKVVTVDMGVANNEMVAFPTVTQSGVTIALEEALNADATVSIINLEGKVVMELPTLLAGQKSMKLDVYSLPTGYYFVKVKSYNHSFTTRFIKE